ncbi:MAG: hypothetical protein AVDCRST_MAG04-2192, partial [uncultured Acetobacteraceae bacterium]
GRQPFIASSPASPVRAKRVELRLRLLRLRLPGAGRRFRPHRPAQPPRRAGRVRRRGGVARRRGRAALGAATGLGAGGGPLRRFPHGPAALLGGCGAGGLARGAPAPPGGGRRPRRGGAREPRARGPQRLRGAARHRRGRHDHRPRAVGRPRPRQRLHARRLPFGHRGRRRPFRVRAAGARPARGGRHPGSGGSAGGAARRAGARGRGGRLVFLPALAVARSRRGAGAAEAAPAFPGADAAAASAGAGRLLPRRGGRGGDRATADRAGPDPAAWLGRRVALALAGGAGISRRHLGRFRGRLVVGPAGRLARLVRHPSAQRGGARRGGPALGRRRGRRGAPGDRDGVRPAGADLRGAGAGGDAGEPRARRGDPLRAVHGGVEPGRRRRQRGFGRDRRGRAPLGAGAGRGLRLRRLRDARPPAALAVPPGGARRRARL